MCICSCFTDDLPKPQITVQPETQSAIKETNVTFVCSAASSSDSPMTFAWKKDNEILNDAEIHNQAHVRSQAGEVSEVTEYTTTLQLRSVEFSSEGKYQCVISNHFGSSYSNKAKLTVNSKCSHSSAHTRVTHYQDLVSLSFLKVSKLKMVHCSLIPLSVALLHENADGSDDSCGGYGPSGVCCQWTSIASDRLAERRRN